MNPNSTSRARATTLARQMDAALAEQEEPTPVINPWSILAWSLVFTVWGTFAPLMAYLWGAAWQ